MTIPTKALRFATFAVAGLCIGLVVAIVFNDNGLFWPAAGGVWLGTLWD